MRKVLFSGLVTLVVFGVFGIGCGEEENPIEWTPYATPWGENSGTGISSTPNKINIQEYFPLAIGNTWHYQILADGSPVGTYTIYIKEVVKLEWKEYFEIRIICNDGYDTVVGWFRIENNEVMVRDDNPWNETGMITYLAPEWVEAVGEVTVPAGRFTCVMHGWRGVGDCYWYGKGVGEVKADLRIVEGKRRFHVLTDYVLR